MTPDWTDPGAFWQMLLDGGSRPGVLGVAGLTIGLGLLFAGGKLLRTGLALAGMAAGGLLGTMLLPRFAGPTIEGLNSPLVGLIGGSLVGLALGLALFRLALGMASSVTFAILGACIAAGVVAAAHPGAIAMPDLQAARQRVVDNAAQKELETTDSQGNAKMGKDAATVGHAFATAAADEATDAWRAIDPQNRLWIAGGLVGGWLLGMFMSAVAPRKAAAMTTAMLGAALAIPCAIALLPRAGIAEPALAPTTWIVIAAGTALLGAGFQGMSSRKMTAKAIPAAPQAPAQPAA